MAKDIRVALELDNRQFNRGIQDSTKQVDKFGSSSKKQMAAFAVAVGTATAAFAGLRKGLNVAAEFQDLRSSLSTVFGSVSAGAEAFQNVTDIASRTQFQVQDITKAFIQLKGAGIDPTEQTIMTFANAAAITTDQLGAFQAAISLLSRTTAGGLGLEELERLGDRGIPVYDILNEKLGITRLQISEVGKTAAGAQKIIKALGDGINERFGTALESRLANTNQRISNFNDALAVLADNVLAGLNEGFGDLLAGLTSFIQKVNQSADAIIALGKAMGIAAGIAATAFGGAGILVLFNNLGKAAGFLSGAITGMVRAFKFVTGISAATAALNAHNRITGALTMRTEKLTLAQRKNLRLFAGGAALLQFTGVVYGLIKAYQLYQDVLEQREVKIIDAIVGEGRENVEKEIEDLALKVLDLTDAMNLYYESTRFSTRPVGITLGIKAAEIEKLQKRIETLREKLTSDPTLQVVPEVDEETVSTLDKIAKAIDGIDKNFRSPKQFKIFVDSLMALKGELKSNEEFAAFDKALKDIEKAFDMEIDPPAEELTRFQEILKDIAKVENFEDFDAVMSTIKNAFDDGDLKGIDQYNELVKKLGESFTEAEQGIAIFQNAIADIDTQISDDLVNATFKEAIKQMIADTIRLMVVQTALQAIFGFFGYSATFAPSGGVTELTKRQFGGPVMKNKPYIVGEDGPELFMPKTGGNIVPNGQLGGMGTQQNVTYNIQAVDAPSFQALVARDPDFIHAVASKGAQNMPSGRRF
jgi:hypothetical protein